MRFRFALGVGIVAVGGVLSTAGAPATSTVHSTPRYATTRTFVLAAGPAERRFTMRERSGVILLSRLTVPAGVRAYVDATIPRLAGTRFSAARHTTRR